VSATARTARRPPRPRRPRRPRETAAGRRARARTIFDRLARLYPDAACALVHRDPLELVVATILSAQCTDARVNQVTPRLFARCPTAADYAAIPTAELEELIRPTGFFRNKAKALVGLGEALVARHGGAVPDSMAELVRLPGVGRKTANVVLGNAFAKNEGVVVDTHVGRLARRLGWTRADDPIRVERDLARLFDAADWTLLAHLLIAHGRAVCLARKPRCAHCRLNDLCPSSTV
jgi:endonuclease-3